MFVTLLQSIKTNRNQGWTARVTISASQKANGERDGWTTSNGKQETGRLVDYCDLMVWRKKLHR